MYRFSKRSLNNLKGVHPYLVAIMTVALANSKYDFTITEGLRSLERQKQLKAEGKSQTLKSKHLQQEDGFGHAVDIVAYLPKVEGQKAEITWELDYYKEINKTVQEIADKLGIKITWGGSWKSFIDSPHFQFDGLK